MTLKELFYITDLYVNVNIQRKPDLTSLLFVSQKDLPLKSKYVLSGMIDDIYLSEDLEKEEIKGFNVKDNTLIVYI